MRRLTKASALLLAISAVTTSSSFLFPWGSESSEEKDETARETSTVPPEERVDCWPEPMLRRQCCLDRGCHWDPEFYPDTDENDCHRPRKIPVPLCYYPRGTGYVTSPSGPYADDWVQLDRSLNWARNPYDNYTESITFQRTRLGSAYHISIGTDGRYVPPVPIDMDANIRSEEPLEVVFQRSSFFDPKPFSFVVRRQSNGVELWNTKIGGLMFGDHYIQIATYLPKGCRIYGFGEHAHHTLARDLTKYQTWGMFASDRAVDATVSPSFQNLYGVHPFYLAVENDGKAHGVFIFNSNAQEVTLGPAPHLVYRTIGGQLDVFFFPGPTPEEVIQQYQQVIGRPFLPPYWALGYQLSAGFPTLEDMKQTIRRIRDNGIPLDVVHSDIQYMDEYRDFTISEDWRGLPDYVRDLQRDGMHFIPITDPAIEVTTEAFDRALKAHAKFIEWPTDELVPAKIQSKYNLTEGTRIMLGVVWPSNHSAFPDFFDSNTVDWWKQEFMEFHKTLSFDGVWVDMNEPANLATNEEYPAYEDDHPAQYPLMCPIEEEKYKAWEAPEFKTSNVYLYGRKHDYMVKNVLSTDTLCMVASTQAGRFYDTKNLYGWSESVATQPAVQAATGKRGLVVSRSTFPSSGRYAGHWLGDNRATWQDLQVSVNGVLDFNFFGIPYVGADVCGFNEPASQEMCLRWHQLGAFHSLYRNHNTDSAPPQDPAKKGWEHVLNATKKANLWRYRHLPYLYTLHFRASLVGGTVIRPVFFEFPRFKDESDPRHAQFMWGEAIMVVPVLVPESAMEMINRASVTGCQHLKVYLPDAVWYSIRDYRYGERMSCVASECCEPTPRNMMIPVYARGGYIIPRQAPSMTTTASRLNEFQLLIVLDGGSPIAKASGELYWDDGERIVDNFETYDYWHFTFKAKMSKEQTTLLVTALRKSQDPNLRLPTVDELEFFGHQLQPNLREAKLNGGPLSIESSGNWNSTSKLLRIRKPGLLDLNYGGIQDTWTISWPNVDTMHESDLFIY